MHVSPTFNSLPVEPGKKFSYKYSAVEIATLRFCISGIQFYLDNELVDEVAKKHRLTDIENPTSLAFSHSINKNKKYKRVQFSIGMDSIANVSGAFGSDLDPTNGMYWAWQSGYINFKLEGNHTLPKKNWAVQKIRLTFYIQNMYCLLISTGT